MLSMLLAWIDGSEEAPPFENQLLTLSFFEKEHIVEQEKHSKLIAQARVARYSRGPTLEGPLIESLRVEEHKRLLDFIEFSKKELAIIGEDTLFSLALKYCLGAKLIPKSTQLFMALLHEDKTKTLNFYEENKGLFKDCEEINRQVAKELTEIKISEAITLVKKYLGSFTEEFAAQENALGISELFKTELDDVEKFAALLLWLLQQGVSSESIIKTHLLHDFLRYHLFTLDREESSIRQLYILLGKFPEAKQLIAQAGNVSCDERGFERYSLDGVLHEEQSGLRSEQALIAPWDFTPTLENFAALFKWFGQPFLFAAVLTHKASDNSTWITALKRCLNHQSMFARQLPTLINHIALAAPTVLSMLARLIDGPTAEQLILLKSGAVLHLLPYMPALFEKIQTINVEEYIQQFCVSNSSGPDAIGQLLAMLAIFLKHNHSSAGLVFDTIIEKLFDNPHLADDTEMLWQLKKYPQWSIHLVRRYTQLQQQFEDSITSNTIEMPLSSGNYHSIEDTWLDVSRKLQTLSYLYPQAKFDFHDKYSLYIRVVQACFKQQGSAFDVDAFIPIAIESTGKITCNKLKTQA